MDLQKKKEIGNLLIRIKNGDFEAIEQLHIEIGHILRYIALKYVHSVFYADDLVQDFWANIDRIARGFRIVCNPYSYLRKTMVNLALNFLKKNGKEKERFSYVDYESIPSKEGTEESIERKMEIENAMQLLTEKEKQVIQLAYFEEMTVREIAKDIHCSKSRISEIQNNAIKKMRKYFENGADK